MFAAFLLLFLHNPLLRLLSIRVILFSDGSRGPPLLVSGSGPSWSIALRLAFDRRFETSLFLLLLLLPFSQPHSLSFPFPSLPFFPGGRNSLSQVA